MSAILISAVVTGSLYGLAALGLVLTYRTSGVFNFAHGAAGMFIAFSMWDLTHHGGLPVWLALVIVLCIEAPLVGLLFELIFYPLREASSTIKLIVSLAALTFLQNLALVLFGSNTQTLPRIFPNGRFLFLGVRVGYDQVGTVAVALIACAGLALLLNRTPLGLKMRAVVDNPTLPELVGVPTRRVRMYAWVIGMVFAGLSGLLLSVFSGLDTSILTLFVIAAFSAAMLGKLSSLPLAIGGGYVLALLQNLVTFYFASSLSGLADGLTFILLVALLLVYRRSLEGARRSESLVKSFSAARVGTRTKVLVGAIGMVVVLALPEIIPRSRLYDLTGVVLLASILVSLVVLVGFSGQISLAHASFVGIGAFVAAHLIRQSGGGFFVAILVAMLISAGCGALICLVSWRLSGLFLALSTMGFALLMDNVVFQLSSVSHGGEGITVNRPAIFGFVFRSDLRFYYLCAAVLILFSAGTLALQRSRTGRKLNAMRDSAAALEVVGVNPAWLKMGVFMATGAMASIAGILVGSFAGIATGANYSMFVSVTYLIALALGGVTYVGGAIVGAVLLSITSFFHLSGTVSNYLNLGIGGVAIQIALYPNGLIEYWGRQLAGLGIIGSKTSTKDVNVVGEPRVDAPSLRQVDEVA
jgi:branched-subunit amino acid ABC-type transport system permease component